MTRAFAPINRPRALIRTLLLTLLGVLVVLPGCNRIQLAYGTAPFFIERYADDYLTLDSEQLTHWEPQLKAALDAHRTAELPLLAGFFDAFYKASRQGFDATNTHCLTEAFRELYRRHARLAVGAAAPLLAQLKRAQVQALDRRFAAEYAKELARPGTHDAALQVRKRTKRYTQAIEEWTGPLSAAQRALVAQVSGRLPDTSEAVLEYRTRKRRELIALLQTGANEAAIQGFLTAWLVDYRDLPPSLVAAGDQLGKAVEDLLIRLGASLDQTQRGRLNDRLATLRDDLMQIQKVPRLVPLSCRA